MKIILTALAVISVATTANELTIKYPKDECIEIVSSDFSAPSSESSLYLYEITCRGPNGKYTTFVDTWSSGASFFGFSRAGSPDRIDLVPYDGNVLEIVND